MANASSEEAHDRARLEAADAQDKIQLLKKLVVELLNELELLSYVPTPIVEEGLDFYSEVSRFEVEMIRRALIASNGHQTKAAGLLNLKPSTLNAKIKHYTELGIRFRVD